MMHNVYRNGKVHICATQCKTCIFRPGNLMMLGPGVVQGMVKEATDDNTGGATAWRM